MSGKRDLTIELDEEAAETPVEASSNGTEIEEKTVEQFAKERDEYRELLQRKQAEFENYRKRTQKEKGTSRTVAKAEVLRELLAVLDAGEKGLESLFGETEDVRLDAYREGYELLINEVRGILERAGVETVPGPGSPFDPNLHEAVLREESENHGDGEILEEYRRGYVLQDLLLRPSQVKVSVRTDSSGEVETDEINDAPGPSAEDRDSGEPAGL